MSGGRHEDLSHVHVTSLDQLYFFICNINYMREKGRDLTQSYDKIPYTNGKLLKTSKVTKQKRHHNVRLNSDCVET